jgi:hypothetical protein
LSRSDAVRDYASLKSPDSAKDSDVQLSGGSRLTSSLLRTATSVVSTLSDKPEMNKLKGFTNRWSLKGETLLLLPIA